MVVSELMNFVGGTWRPSRATERLVVLNPATAETLALVPLSVAVIERWPREWSRAF